MTGREYVYAVFQEGSFSAAARRLFISQPALSAAVKKVEEELGMPIFDRSATPLALTEAGEVYVRAAEKIFRLEAEVRSYFGDLAGLERGHLSLGGTNFSVSSYLPPLIEAFTRLHPRISLSVMESGTAEVYARLESGELDAILDSGEYDEKKFAALTLVQDQLLLALPRDWMGELGEEERAGAMTREEILAGEHLKEDAPLVPLASFERFPFLLLGRGNDMQRRSHALFSAAKISPEVKLELNQLMTAFHMARHKLGATFLTDSLVRVAVETDALVYFRLTGEISRRKIYLATRRHSYESAALKAFLKSSLELFKGDKK